MSDEQKATGTAVVPQTKEEIIARAKTLPPTDVFNFKPRTFEEAYRFANVIAASTMIPKEFQNNPANVLIALQLGMELGVPPMQALQSIAVINGRPAIWGDLIPAIVYQSKLCEQFDEVSNDKEATCTVKRKGMPPVKRTFTWEDAKRAGLTEKDTYRKFPARMLQMRARGYAVRDAFADVLKGVHLREELEDLEPRDVTPMATPKALEHKEPEKQADEKSATVERLGRDNAQATTSNIADGQSKAPTSPRTDKAKAKNAKETKETPAEQTEKSQDEIIAECLSWIASAPEDQLNQEKDNWLLAQLPRLKGTANQMAVLRPFNDRRHAINK